MFNLKKIDERIRIAGFFILRFRSVLVAGRKDNSFQAAEAFAKATGSKAIIGRFPPGMLTNPSFKEFCEPDLVIVADPVIDEQAVKEANAKRIPVIGICNTFNTAKHIDYIIPANNNGKKSLALIFWLLAREVLKNKGEIKTDEDFKLTLKDFGDTEIAEKRIEEGGAGLEEAKVGEPEKMGKKAEKKAKTKKKAKKTDKKKETAEEASD